MTSLDLIGASEAAQILRLSPRTVKRMATAGDLEFVTRLAGDRGDYVFAREVIVAKRTQMDRIEELEAELAQVKASAS